MRPTKSFLLSFVPISFSFVFFGPITSAAGEDAVPKAQEKSRYDALCAKSPFAIATAVVAPVQQPLFAANWYVTSVARVDDTNFATIKSRDLTTQFSLYGDQAVDGVVLASVEWSDTIGKSAVILRKGTETARLEFNEAQLRAPAGATAGASPAPVGGKPGRTTTAATGTPRTMGMTVATANNNPLPNQPGSGPPRRRVLPIPVPR